MYPRIIKKLISMKRYGNGWSFTLCDTDEYRTDKNGEGLWRITPGGEAFQMRGLIQFSLSKTRTTAYKQIAREFADELAFWKLIGR